MTAPMTDAQIDALPYRQNVGIMVVNEDGKIWAGRRIDSDQNAWQMPQGGIDKGESPRIAAIRELWEETGIDAGSITLIAETDDWVRYDLPRDLVPKLWKGRWRGQEQKWFLMRFTGSEDEINIASDHPEFNAWGWFDPDDLVDRIVPFKRDVYRRVMDELTPHI